MHGGARKKLIRSPKDEEIATKDGEHDNLAGYVRS